MSSNFVPTSAELALVNQIFAQADTQKIGILTGDVAVKVFQGAKLTPTVLGEIWNIADDDNNGFLTKKGVSIAVRLMGHAQKGQKVDKSLVNKRQFHCSFTMTHY
jgi:epidermal growth factor receptor substrate 15